MRTTVDLDPILLKRLRQEARRRGVPFKEALAGVLRRGLDAPATPKAARYRCPTFSMGAPGPGVNLHKALALAAALEDEQVALELAGRR